MKKHSVSFFFLKSNVLAKKNSFSKPPYVQASFQKKSYVSRRYRARFKRKRSFFRKRSLKKKLFFTFPSKAYSFSKRWKNVRCAQEASFFSRQVLFLSKKRFFSYMKKPLLLVTRKFLPLKVCAPFLSNDHRKRPNKKLSPFQVSCSAKNIVRNKLYGSFRRLQAFFSQKKIVNIASFCLLPRSFYFRKAVSSRIRYFVSNIKRKRRKAKKKKNLRLRRLKWSRRVILTQRVLFLKKASSSFKKQYLRSIKRYPLFSVFPSVMVCKKMPKKLFTKNIFFRYFVCFSKEKQLARAQSRLLLPDAQNGRPSLDYNPTLGWLKKKRTRMYLFSLCYKKKTSSLLFSKDLFKKRVSYLFSNTEKTVFKQKLAYNYKQRFRKWFNKIMFTTQIAKAPILNKNQERLRYAIDQKRNLKKLKLQTLIKKTRNAELVSFYERVLNMKELETLRFDDLVYSDLEQRYGFGGPVGYRRNRRAFVEGTANTRWAPQGATFYFSSHPLNSSKEYSTLSRTDELFSIYARTSAADSNYPEVSSVVSTQFFYSFYELYQQCERFTSYSLKHWVAPWNESFWSACAFKLNSKKLAGELYLFVLKNITSWILSSMQLVSKAGYTASIFLTPALLSEELQVRMRILLFIVFKKNILKLPMILKQYSCLLVGCNMKASTFVEKKFLFFGRNKDKFSSCLIDKTLAFLYRKWVIALQNRLKQFFRPGAAHNYEVYFKKIVLFLNRTRLRFPALTQKLGSFDRILQLFYKKTTFVFYKRKNSLKFIKPSFLSFLDSREEKKYLFSLHSQQKFFFASTLSGSAYYAVNKRKNFASNHRLVDFKTSKKLFVPKPTFALQFSLSVLPSRLLRKSVVGDYKNEFGFQEALSLRTNSKVFRRLTNVIKKRRLPLEQIRRRRRWEGDEEEDNDDDDEDDDASDDPLLTVYDKFDKYARLRSYQWVPSWASLTVMLAKSAPRTSHQLATLQNSLSLITRPKWSYTGFSASKKKIASSRKFWHEAWDYDISKISFFSKKKIKKNARNNYTKRSSGAFYTQHIASGKNSPIFNSLNFIDSLFNVSLTTREKQKIKARKRLLIYRRYRKTYTCTFGFSVCLKSQLNWFFKQQLRGAQKKMLFARKLLLSIYWNIRIYLAECSISENIELNDAYDAKLLSIRNYLSKVVPRPRSFFNFSQKMRFRLQIYNVYLQAPELENALDWLKVFFPKKQKLYLEDSEEFKNVFLSEKRIHRSYLSKKNAGAWQTVVTKNYGSDRVFCALPAAFPEASRVENFLGTSRRPVLRVCGSSKKLHSKRTFKTFAMFTHFFRKFSSFTKKRLASPTVFSSRIRLLNVYTSFSRQKALGHLWQNSLMLRKRSCGQISSAGASFFTQRRFTKITRRVKSPRGLLYAYREVPSSATFRRSDFVVQSSLPAIPAFFAARTASAFFFKSSLRLSSQIFQAGFAPHASLSCFDLYTERLRKMHTIKLIQKVRLAKRSWHFCQPKFFTKASIRSCRITSKNALPFLQYPTAKISADALLRVASLSALFSKKPFAALYNRKRFRKILSKVGTRIKSKSIVLAQKNFIFNPNKILAKNEVQRLMHVTFSNSISISTLSKNLYSKFYFSSAMFTNKRQKLQILSRASASREEQKVRLEFDEKKHELWEELTVQWAKKNRTLKTWLKFLKWELKRVPTRIFTLRAFKALSAELKKLTWEEKDDLFERDYLNKAFAFRISERKQGFWLEALMYRRAAYNTLRGYYRRYQIPQELKRLKWLQRYRKQFFTIDPQKAYLRSRRWLQLRVYNKRLFNSFFSFRNTRVAQKHFKKSQKRSTINGFANNLMGLFNRLDVVLILLNLATTVFWAKILVKKGLLRINGVISLKENFRLQEGDVLEWNVNQILKFKTYFQPVLKKYEEKDWFRCSSSGLPKNFFYKSSVSGAIFSFSVKREDISKSSRLRFLLFEYFRLDAKHGK